MARYRHTVTGAVRDSSTRKGFPWELVVDASTPAGNAGGSGSASMTLEQLRAEAKDRGLATSGTKAEVAERIQAFDREDTSL